MDKFPPLPLPRRYRSQVSTVTSQFTPEEAKIRDECIARIDGRLHQLMAKGFDGKEREFQVTIEKNEQNRPELKILPEGWLAGANNRPEFFVSDVNTIQLVKGELASAVTLKAGPGTERPAEYVSATTMSFSSILDLARGIKAHNPNFDLSALGERTVG